jgi:mono/diheme cytochrome c family protein
MVTSHIATFRGTVVSETMKHTRIIGITACVLPVLAAGALIAFSLPALADCGFKKGDWKAGDKIYHQTCYACHGENGKGAVPGTPDFTKKGGVLSEPHQELTKHIKNGFAPPGATMAMPAKGGNPDLTDKDIEDVHAYLHHQFGCG